jgi:hypothetical protein
VILAAVTMLGMVGFGALAIDVGSWYHAQRQLQSDVDAAALAGAQSLPDAVTGGSVLAAQQAAKAFFDNNASGNPDTRRTLNEPSFPAPTGAGCTVSDCIAVTDTSPNGSILGTVFGWFGVSLTARAQAYVGPPNAANDTLAAALDAAQYNCLVSGSTTSTACKHTSCTGTLPCNNVTLNFDNPTYGETLLDLRSGTATMPPASASCNNVNTNLMQTWLNPGFNGELQGNEWYCEDADAGSHDGIKVAFRADGTTVNLIPIFDTGTPTANSHALHVIGFAAFIIAAGPVKWQGGTSSPKHELNGNLVQFVTSGLGGSPGSGSFGVTVVGLDQ